MKILFFLTFLLSISFGCTSQKRSSKTIKKEIYQYKWPNGLSDFIELSYTDDTSAGGLYRGVFIGEDNSLVFFKSDFITIKSDIVYDLFFQLDSFVFSKTAFQSQNTSDYTIKPFASEIPFIFQYPMTFLGSYSGDTLNIVRSTARDIGSKADNMVFIKAPVVRSIRN